MNRWLICGECVFSDRLVDMEGTKKGLTTKQRNFIREYVNNGRNCAAAYRDAGYSFANENSLASASSKLLANPKVRREVNKGLVKIRESTERNTEITREFLIGKYLEVIEGSLEGVRPHYSAARGALDSLANITGHWVDRRLTEVTGSVGHVMAELSRGELLELIGRRNDNVIEGDAKVIEGADSDDSI